MPKTATARKTSAKRQPRRSPVSPAGVAVKAYREQRSITQVELARLADIHAPRINEVENGKRTAFSNDDAAALERASNGDLDARVMAGLPAR